MSKKPRHDIAAQVASLGADSLLPGWVADPSAAKKFTITVGYADPKKDGDRTWTEDYTEITADAAAWARALIKQFNDTTRPGEKKRRYVGIEVISAATAPTRHAWTKTNLATQVYRGRMFDRMKCERCGITGKRFRLGENITRDSFFRPRVYLQCDTASAHLAEKKAKHGKA